MGLAAGLGGHLDWLAGKRLEQFACEELWKKREKCVGVYMCRSAGLASRKKRQSKRLHVCLTVLTFNRAELIFKCSVLYLTMLRMFDLIHVQFLVKLMIMLTNICQITTTTIN